MSKTSIAEINLQLADLNECLEHAYWEASSMSDKDLFHDLISALHSELSELAKLSVQDHDLEYEAISLEFRRSRMRLKDLRKNLDNRISRAATAAKLESTLSELAPVFAD